MSAKENFVDEAFILVTSGKGGDGMVSFRREKFEPNGGPDGGDGGNGGDVILVADRNLRTLLDLRHRREIKARSGQPGGKAGRTGARGKIAEIRLPVGTAVFDAEAPDDSEPIVDLTTEDQRVVVCSGGRGGHGNTRFKSSTRQAPRFAKPGLPGESRDLRLCLKLLADVGLLGFPNAGKSTLLRQVSHAKPRVGSYPFTTLVPSLGVVERGEQRIVVADIPGLIEGASEGAGLGDRFLRHIERTRVLIHLLDCGAMLFEQRDLLADYDALRRELANYRPELAERREIVALNKIDVASESPELESLEAAFAERGIATHRISGATGEGCGGLMDRTLVMLQDAVEEAAREQQDALKNETDPPLEAGT